MFDLAFDREQRREKQGYVTPAQARAFLQMSRQLRLGHDATPPGNPVARAYFRAIEWTTAADANSGSQPFAGGIRRAARSGGLRRCGRRRRRRAPRRGCPPAAASSVARRTAGARAASRAHPGAHAVRARLRPRRLFDEEPGARLSCEHDRGRMFHPGTALYGAGGVGRGRRGLQPWPGELAASLAPGGARRGSSAVDAGTALPDDFLVGHDLVSVFQVGWTVLHDDVCMYAAERLIGVLTRLRCDDRETQAGLDALRIEMARHWQAGAPWRARDALDVIAILDMPAWAALLGLIDECPVIHAGIGASRESADARGQRLGLRVHFGEQPDRVRPRIHAVAAGNTARLTAARLCGRVKKYDIQRRHRRRPRRNPNLRNLRSLRLGCVKVWRRTSGEHLLARPMTISDRRPRRIDYRPPASSACFLSCARAPARIFVRA